MVDRKIVMVRHPRFPDVRPQGIPENALPKWLEDGYVPIDQEPQDEEVVEEAKAEEPKPRRHVKKSAPKTSKE